MSKPLAALSLIAVFGLFIDKFKPITSLLLTTFASNLTR